MHILYRRILAAVIVSILFESTAAFAESGADNKRSTGSRALSVGIGFSDDPQPLQSKAGLGLGFLPKYEGSDKHAASSLLLLEITKRGAFFVRGASINPDNGILSAGISLLHLSYTVDSVRRLQVVMGPIIRAYGGRDESENDSLTGMGDMDRSAGSGGFIELNAESWRMNIGVSSQDISNDSSIDTEGVLATLDIEHSALVTDSLRLSSGISTSWADDDYMQGYFGLNSAQAALTGLSEFVAKAGLKDVGLQLKASYRLSPQWVLEGQIGYWRLLNEAADSPIVKDEGSENQVRGLIGFSYQF